MPWRCWTGAGLVVGLWWVVGGSGWVWSAGVWTGGGLVRKVVLHWALLELLLVLSPNTAKSDSEPAVT